MEPVAEFTKLGWAFSGRVKSDQILPGWISQFGRLVNRTYFTFVEISHVQEKSKKCTQEGSLLSCVMVPSSEETFQSLSQQIDLADSDVLQNPDRILETEDVSVDHPENTELVASQEDCETDIPEEESVLLFSERDVDECSCDNEYSYSQKRC